MILRILEALKNVLILKQHFQRVGAATHALNHKKPP